jgi:hypothetical protein
MIPRKAIAPEAIVIARCDPEEGHRPRGDRDRAVLAEHLRDHVRTEVVLVGRRPGHDQAGGDRQQECWYLRHEAVTDAQQAVAVHGVGQGHVLLHYSYSQTADQVDGGYHDGGYGVASDELRRTVHGPVEVGLVGYLAAPSTRLGLVYDPRVEVGVDRHLLTRHGVQGEAGCYLGDAAGTVGHDHELDDYQDQEDDQADYDLASHHEVPERRDNRPCVAV